MNLNGHVHGYVPPVDRDEPHFIVLETCAHCDRPLSDDGITGPDGEHYHRACFGLL